MTPAARGRGALASVARVVPALAIAALLSPGPGLPRATPRSAGARAAVPRPDAAAAGARSAPAGAPAGRDAEGFLYADAPWAFRFPADHAAHEAFRTEWWYYTGHLVGGARRFGFELTFFRVGVPQLRGPSRSAWAARDLVFVHVALTDETRGTYRAWDAARRAVLGQAWADSTRFDVGLEPCFARLAADGRTHELHAAAPAFAFTLSLEPARPEVVHGRGGVSRKAAGAGNTSHYYSITRLAARGGVRADRESLAVAGDAWMDHEFGSAGLSATHEGWDWFSLQLDDGRDLMLYSLRRRDGAPEPFAGGTLVERDGRARTIGADDFAVHATRTWTSPHTGGRYPAGWLVRVPRAGLDLELVPTLADQEFRAGSMGGVVYWEGSVRVRARAAGGPGGHGYVELTGYAGRPPF